MARLPGEVDGHRFLRAMARFGWAVVSQRGSHRKLENAATGGTLIVAFHNVIRRNTVRNVLRAAGIDEDEFIRLL